MIDPAQVPKPENRSGLSQLSYRIGDYATVRQRLLSQIAHLTLNGPSNNRPLAHLTSRSPDDPAIALLDAWAVVADVLTFYQERIINEGYLLTATERQSVLELARTIGYELAPGVAASTFLAFTVEDAAGSAGVATVPKGTQVLSLPLRQDELPQTFETSADLLARADWNALLPRPARPQQITGTTRQLFLSGITTQLQVGDALLLRDGADPTQNYLLDLVAVQSLNQRNSTQVEWRDWLPAAPPKPLRQPQIFAFRQKAQLFDQSIRGGVFRLSSGSSAWITQNLGLPNAEVTCLASLDDAGLGSTLFLGGNSGVFRLSAEGVWEAVNNGLTLLNVQSLAVGAGGLLFAGTLNGGLFRSSDQGETWVQINLGSVELRDVGGGKQQPFSTGLPNSVVRAVLVPFTTTDGSGTIQSDQSGRVVGDGTQFTQAFASGRQIVVGNQRRSVSVISDTELQLDRSFQGSALSYVATALIGDSAAIQETDGTILNVGTTVTGIDTHFLRLQAGPAQLTALDQARTITQILSDTELLIDRPFDRLVVPSGSTFKIATPFTKTYLVGTDDGVYLTDDRGKNWRATNLDDRVVFALLDSGSNRWAGTSTGLYRANTQMTDWQPHKLPDRSVRCLLQFDGLLLAGTDAGVSYSEDAGENWASGDLPPQLVLALTQVNSAVYAATSRGVYRSVNGRNWTAINSGLTTPQIVAIAAQGQDVLAGGRSTNVSAADWQNFLLPAQEIDLDGQYPKILPQSWAVLRNGSEIAVLQIQRAETVARAQANQEAKVTRITPTVAVPQPQRFDRRRTIVLAQSELLPLAEESLTVADQQSRIFADPLAADTVFLQQYVQGLQPQQRLIVSGKAIQAQINQIGGLYRSSPDPIAWTRINRNLDNLQVQALTRQFGVLYAGTRQGVFRSTNAGETWEPFNQGLGRRPVQAFSPATSTLLLAGTPDGLFGWSGQSWQHLTAGLIYQDVQAIAVLSPSTSAESATAIASPMPLLFIGTLGGGLFRSSDGGQTWSPTGLANLDILALAADSQGHLLAGTRGNGLFLSNDRGESWRQITATRPGQGTVASTGIVLTRSGSFNNQQTDPQSDLQPGDRITAGDQSRTILSIEPAITLDAPFRPDLPPGTPFTVATGLTSSTITALAIAPAEDGNPIFYAGTAGNGVFRSKDGGNRWVAVNANLTDLEIRCLGIEVSGRLLVGTASGGLFRSANQGELWAPINPGLRNLDLRAILADAETLLVGGTGILISEATRTTVELQTGDRLQLVAPPLEIPAVEPPAVGTDPFAYQRWLLKDRDGFTGTLETIAPLTAAELTLLPADPNSETISELVTVKTPPDDQQHPVLELAAPLRSAYDPATVTITANVVEATHGETVVEALGSGDGMAINQRFVLQKPPLTYLAADTPSGTASTLELRVNGILWQEVPSLYGHGEAEAYIIRREDDGTTAVSFGDGSSGARLPTGQENVTGVYRSGIGLDGNLGANRLSLLKTQPLGIRGVNNPLPATGAADRERLQEAQVKAPRTVRTLDRIVSLRDFEDFTRTFAGIGKAQSAALWTGNAQIVHLTIAAAGGDPVLPESRLYQKLLAAIDAARDPVQRVQVDSYRPLKFNLEARLLLDPRYEAKTVVPQAEAALEQAFAFEQRAFGQPVTSAEAIAALQTVAGIVAVDLDALYRLGSSRALEPTLAAHLARWNQTTGQFDPAELLLLNPAGVSLTVTPTL